MHESVLELIEEFTSNLAGEVLTERYSLYLVCLLEQLEIASEEEDPNHDINWEEQLVKLRDAINHRLASNEWKYL